MAQILVILWHAQGGTRMVRESSLLEHQHSGSSSAAWDAAKLQRKMKGLQLELKLARERGNLLERNQSTKSNVNLFDALVS